MSKKNLKYLPRLLACFALCIGANFSSGSAVDIDPFVPISGLSEKKSKRVERSQEGLIQVRTSLAPHISIVQAIGGSLVDVSSIVPQTSDPHNFEMAPSQVESLAQSSVWFGGGEGFERQACAALGKKVLYCDLNKGKPHGLLDPDSLKEQAEQVASILKKLDPKNADYFERNLGEYIDNIELTDRKVKEILAQSKNKTLLVMHPTFTSFCEYYGVEQLNASTCDQCVCVRHIEYVEQRVQALKLKTLYIQPQEESAAGAAAAKKLGLETEVLDPYEEDVLANFIKIAKAVS